MLRMVEEFYNLFNDMFEDNHDGGNVQVALSSVLKALEGYGYKLISNRAEVDFVSEDSANVALKAIEEDDPEFALFTLESEGLEFQDIV